MAGSGEQAAAVGSGGLEELDARRPVPASMESGSSGSLHSSRSPRVSPPVVGKGETERRQSRGDRSGLTRLGFPRQQSLTVMLSSWRAAAASPERAAAAAWCAAPSASYVVRAPSTAYELRWGGSVPPCSLPPCRRPLHQHVAMPPRGRTPLLSEISSKCWVKEKQVAENILAQYARSGQEGFAGVVDQGRAASGGGRGVGRGGHSPSPFKDTTPSSRGKCQAAKMRR